jgi:hypothetical protein
MPFAVQLDRFARKEWKAIDVYFPQEKFNSNPPRYTVWPDRVIPLDWQPDASGKLAPSLELRVREIHEHAKVRESQVSEGTPDDGGPTLALAQLDAPAPAKSSNPHDDAPPQPSGRATIYLAPEFADHRVWTDPDGKFRLAVAHGNDPLAAFPKDGDDAIATLWIDVLAAGLDAPVPMRVHVGDSLKLANGYSLNVLEGTRNFLPGRDTDKGSGDKRPLAEQPEGFHAVWIEIVAPGGKESERRLVSQDLDAVENGLQERYKYKDVVVRLRWDRWTEPGAPRFVLCWDDKGKTSLTPQGGTPTAVTPGGALDLPGESRLVLKSVFERARFEKVIDFLPGRVDADGFDPSFYETDARGIVLDVVHFPHTAQETVETIRMATSDDAQANLWQSGDDRVAIRFLENIEGFPFDWRSVLSIVEKDAQGNPHVVDCGTPKEREIRVNEYFKYKGYRFFQTNANPKEPTYSGIGVVYDPGIEIVLLGMYTIIAGTVLAFTVRPIVRAKRRAKVNA